MKQNKWQIRLHVDCSNVNESDTIGSAAQHVGPLTDTAVFTYVTYNMQYNGKCNRVCMCMCVCEVCSLVANFTPFGRLLLGEKRNFLFVVCC